MPDANQGDQARPMRADARRNRQRLLDAAVEMILETGGEPSRDSVAQRAGVGIATLYRHFPEAQDLLRAVAVAVLDQAIAAGDKALAESDGDALRRYLHAAIDAGLGVVNIVHPLLDDTDWPEQTTAAQHMLERLLADARQNSLIAQDVTARNITYAAIRFGRPLLIGPDPAEERAIAHQQLDHYLDGLATAAARPAR